MAFTENPASARPALDARQGGSWDPFFRACEETDTVVCMHIGSSSKMPATSPDAPFIISSTLTFQNAMGSVLDCIFSGTLARFPELTIAYSEGQVGWMPYVFERADKLWEERSDNSFGSWLPEPAVELRTGPGLRLHLRRRDRAAQPGRIGMDQICFETDYPHADSTFPNSKEVLTAICAEAGMSDDEVYKLTRGNAIRAFGLERFGISG